MGCRKVDITEEYGKIRNKREKIAIYGMLRSGRERQTGKERTSLKGKINVPNCITSLRIVGTIVLLFLKPRTFWFLLVYSLAGLTDVLDGYIARKTNKTTDLGAKLDSAADLLYYAVMIFRIFPMLWERLPSQIWMMLGAIIVVRSIGYSLAALKYRRFASQHTWMNKTTGFIVFCVPYVIATPAGAAYCWGACVVAMLAAVEELLMHSLSKQYDPNARTILVLCACRKETANAQKAENK